jgi:hypothetical protein
MSDARTDYSQGDQIVVTRNCTGRTPGTMNNWHTVSKDCRGIFDGKTADPNLALVDLHSPGGGEPVKLEVRYENFEPLQPSDI